MHLDEEHIQRFLHDELDAPSKERLSQHLAECRQCAWNIDEAAREEKAIFDLLRHADHPAPAVHIAAFTGRGRRASAVWGRRAAGIVIVAALAGAAYAVPGSPIPELLKRAVGQITGRPQPPPAGEPAPIQPVTSGISVPADNHFAIHFTAEQDEGVVTVSWTGQAMVVMRVLGGRATFTTDAGRLTIENNGATADYEIEIPRDLQRIEITAGSRSLFLKDGDYQVSPAQRDTQGRIILSLTPSTPGH
ncbi:MAG TPA: anti-sigma factor [Candidatus Krumholzibacteria bacterium]|nr:anti-sigma factor [Candidatus Krumholzibacteria bacterium]